MYGRDTILARSLFLACDTSPLSIFAILVARCSINSSQCRSLKRAAPPYPIRRQLSSRWNRWQSTCRRMVIFRLVRLAKVGNPFPEGFVDPFGDGFFLIPIVFRSPTVPAHPQFRQSTNDLRFHTGVLLESMSVGGCQYDLDVGGN